MTSRADRVKDLFQQALELGAGERTAFLQTECAGDAALEREVRGLLEALDEASGFLAEPRTAAAEEEPGTQIGRYRLVERLGEGGFGVVWRAEQTEPMHRDVALKVIKLGMDTRRVVARFEHERQALARMDHPHIAAVFDGGTTPGGRPFFVMELVRGEPIDEYCSSRGFGVEERVTLLRRVCLAVQHAHQKGLIHRDIKPHNVLVAEADGVPVPKVIDFGIAKAVDEDGGAAVTFTATGHGQMVGTLEYMAPEQAEPGAPDVDSRADVYGLGVLLYEMLTGRRPFERGDDPGEGFTGMLRRIKSEDPCRPSSRVLSADEVHALPGADRHRWARRLRGDLDWIVARALQKRPADRYPTANALAEDLQRFLEGRPVEAGPPTTAYRVRRFVERHRLAVGAALVLVASLVGGIVATSLALKEAHAENVLRREAEQAARAEAEHKGAALAAMHELLTTADPLLQKGHDYTVRAMLDDFASTIDERFGADAEVARELHVTVGASYRSLGQLPEAREHLARALELTRATREPSDPEYQIALIEWAWILREEARHTECLEVLDEARRILEVEAPDGFRMARVEGAIADVHRLMGRPDTGEVHARRALEILAGLEDRREVASARALALDLLGVFASTRGDAERSKELHVRAIETRRTALGEDHPLMAVGLLNLAAAERDLGRLDRAEECVQEALRVQRKAYGERHTAIARSLSFLAELRRSTGQLDEAEDLAKQGLELRQALLPENHPDIAVSLSDLGRIALARRDNVAAERHLREALEIRRAGEDAGDEDSAAVLHNLGVAVDRQGRHEEAERIYREALDIHRRVRGDAHPAVADAMQNVALALAGQERFQEACAMHRQALALRLEHRPDDFERLRMSYSGLRQSCEGAGDLRGAAEAQREYAKVLERTEGEHPQRVQGSWLTAARLFLAAGDPAAATPIVESVHAWCVENLPDSWPRGDTASLLSVCRAAEGRWDEAVALAKEGWSRLDGSPAPLDRQTGALENLAAAHEGRATARGAERDDADRIAAEAARAELARLAKENR